MTRITHIIAGLTVTAAYIGVSGSHAPINTVPLLLTGMVGGVLPDIDLILGDSRKKNTIWKHRGIAHTLLFLAICIFGIIYFKEKFIHYNISLKPEITVFTLAFLSHLFLDSFNMIGVPFLYPITKKGFCLHLFRVGTIQEYGLVTLPMLAVLIILVLNFVPKGDIYALTHNQYFIRKFL
jgi:membrane-bound metal-dependent hydrolase YbcI (DUF457 family)